MQRRFSHAMPPHALRAIALSGLLLAGAGFLSPAWADLPAIQHQGAVEFVSGGIGHDESTSFKQAMSQYPLALTFARMDHGVGEYLADVNVVIRDAHHATVLDTVSQGPYLLARLSPGTYKVTASFKNETRSRNVKVAGNGSARVVFTWQAHD